MKGKNIHPKPRPPSPHDFFDISVLSNPKETIGFIKVLSILQQKSHIYLVIQDYRK